MSSFREAVFGGPGMLVPFSVSEIGCAVVAAFFALIWVVVRSAAAGPPAGFLKIVDAVASRRRTTIAAAGLLTFASHATFGAAVQWPFPAVHDEFSYLLAADTYARGRMTNPTPDHPESFRTYYVLLEPTYQSKYPPAKGLFFAAGQVLTGEPAVGLWLANGAAAAALCWMAFAWLPSRWAVAAAAAYLCNDALFMWWGQTYWGGATPFLGGALLFGGVRRLTTGTPKVVDACLAACGLVVLANSRPYEGAVASLWPAGVLAVSLVAAFRAGRRRDVAAVVVPFAVIGGVCLGAMAAYNRTVTGDPWRLPYVEHVAQKTGMSPSDALGYLSVGVANRTARSERRAPKRLYPTNPDQPEVERSAEKAHAARSASRSESDFQRRKVTRHLPFYVGVLLLGPLLTLPTVVRRPLFWHACVPLVAVIWAIRQNATAGFPHYIAPAAPLLVVAPFLGPAALSAGRAAFARVLTTYTVAAACLLPVAFVGAMAENYYDPPYTPYRGVMRLKQQIETQPADTPGRALIFVRYGLGHGRDFEFVANSADIDGQDVIWARDLGLDANAAVIDRYGRDRKVILMQITNANVQSAAYADYVRFKQAAAANSGPPAAGDGRTDGAAGR